MVLDRAELERRRARFIQRMNGEFPGWDTAILLHKVNQYYFLGTMQDGILLIHPDDSYSYHVRRGVERALAESPLEAIYPMDTYRDAAERVGKDLGKVYLDMEMAPYGMVERLKRAFQMESLGSLDRAVLDARAVKSAYELYWMMEAGKAHAALMERVPSFLVEGMTEAELVGKLFDTMMHLGYQGITRFRSFGTEIVMGQFGFGESSLIPSSFDGPAGHRGMGPAVPLAGSRDRRLQKGDLVFVDCGFGMKGYHTDKTQVFSYGEKPEGALLEAHQCCMELEENIAKRLVPGAIPQKIYEDMMAKVPREYERDFMGFDGRTVKFLGHGIGLFVDEMPVIAKGFDAPLEKGTTLALEPKIGMRGRGMVGVEETHVVSDEGGKCITGGGREILVV